MATIKLGMIVPFFYSIFVLWVIRRAIRYKFREERPDGHAVSKWEALLVYGAVLPWVCMTVFSYLQVSQWVEVLFTNGGFILSTSVFMSHAVLKQKLAFQKLEQLSSTKPSEQQFEDNLLQHDFSSREIEIIRLLHRGLSKHQIAGTLFIATATVSRHVQNIYYKAQVSRLELMRKLETQPP